MSVIISCSLLKPSSATVCIQGQVDGKNVPVVKKDTNVFTYLNNHPELRSLSSVNRFMAIYYH